MNRTKLKYLKILDEISTQPCPCIKKFSEDSLTGFRFVKKPLTQKCLIPQAKKTPPPVDGKKCEHWSLSFFESLIKARAKYSDLKNKGIVMEETFGTHIGQFYITSKSGVVCKPSSKGHFDLHEYKDFECDESSCTYHDVVKSEEKDE